MSLELHLHRGCSRPPWHAYIPRVENLVSAIWVMLTRSSWHRNRLQNVTSNFTCLGEEVMCKDWHVTAESDNSTKTALVVSCDGRTRLRERKKKLNKLAFCWFPIVLPWKSLSFFTRILPSSKEDDRKLNKYPSTRVLWHAAWEALAWSTPLPTLPTMTVSAITPPHMLPMGTPQPPDQRHVGYEHRLHGY